MSPKDFKARSEATIRMTNITGAINEFIKTRDKTSDDVVIIDEPTEMDKLKAEIEKMKKHVSKLQKPSQPDKPKKSKQSKPSDDAAKKPADTKKKPNTKPKQDQGKGKGAGERDGKHKKPAKGKGPQGPSERK